MPEIKGGQRGEVDPGQSAFSPSAASEAQGAKGPQGPEGSAQVPGPGPGAAKTVLEERFLLTPDGFDDFWKDVQDTRRLLLGFRQDVAALTEHVSGLRGGLLEHVAGVREVLDRHSVGLERHAAAILEAGEVPLIPDRPARSPGALLADRPIRDPRPAAPGRTTAGTPASAPKAAATAPRVATPTAPSPRRRPATSERGAPQTSGRGGFVPPPKLSLGVRAELPPPGPPPEQPAAAVQLRRLGFRASVRSRLLTPTDDFAGLLDELGIVGFEQRQQVRDIVAFHLGNDPDDLD